MFKYSFGTFIRRTIRYADKFWHHSLSFCKSHMFWMRKEGYTVSTKILFLVPAQRYITAKG